MDFTGQKKLSIKAARARMEKSVKKPEEMKEKVNLEKHMKNGVSFKSKWKHGQSESMESAL